MTPELLYVYAGALLSLIISYVPGINEKYAALSPAGKRVAMLILLAATAVGTLGYTCLGWTGAPQGVSCDQSGAVGLLRAFVFALIGNQAAFLSTPQTAKVIEAKAAAKTLALAKG